MALEAVGSNPTTHPIYFKRSPEMRWLYGAKNGGVSPSGKAQDFDSCIRRFKSCHPSHLLSNLAQALACFVGQAPILSIIEQLLSKLNMTH